MYSVAYGEPASQRISAHASAWQGRATPRRIPIPVLLTKGLVTATSETLVRFASVLCPPYSQEHGKSSMNDTLKGIVGGGQAAVKGPCERLKQSSRPL